MGMYYKLEVMETWNSSTLVESIRQAMKPERY